MFSYSGAGCSGSSRRETDDLSSVVSRRYL
jgi:hypothetical protein